MFFKNAFWISRECLKHGMASKNSSRNMHLRTWARMVWIFAASSHGAKMKFRARIAARLLRCFENLVFVFRKLRSRYRQAVYLDENSSCSWLDVCCLHGTAYGSIISGSIMHIVTRSWILWLLKALRHAICLLSLRFSQRTGRERQRCRLY